MLKILYHRTSSVPQTLSGVSLHSTPIRGSVKACDSGPHPDRLWISSVQRYHCFGDTVKQTPTSTLLLWNLGLWFCHFPCSPFSCLLLVGNEYVTLHVHFHGITFCNGVPKVVSSTSWWVKTCFPCTVKRTVIILLHNLSHMHYVVLLKEIRWLWKYFFYGKGEGRAQLLA